MTRPQSLFPSSVGDVFEVSFSIFTGSGPDVSRRAGFRPAYLIQALKQGGTGSTTARTHGPLLCGEVRECAAVVLDRFVLRICLLKRLARRPRDEERISG